MRSIQAATGNCDRNHLELTVTSSIFDSKDTLRATNRRERRYEFTRILSDPNRHSKQPNSFAAVQTTWNKSGTKAPKPQTNSESRATVAAGSSGKKSSHEFHKEISRLDMKITKVATTVGTLYNQINLLIEKQNSSGASNGRQTVDAGRNSLQTDKTGGSTF